MGLASSIDFLSRSILASFSESDDFPGDSDLPLGNSSFGLLARFIVDSDLNLLRRSSTVTLSPIMPVSISMTLWIVFILFWISICKHSSQIVTIIRGNLKMRKFVMGIKIFRCFTELFWFIKSALENLLAILTKIRFNYLQLLILFDNAIIFSSTFFSNFVTLLP